MTGYFTSSGPQSLYLVGGIISGIVVHHGVFIHGEWHVRAPDVVYFYAGIFCCLAAFRFFSHNPEVMENIGPGLLMAYVTHVFGLMMSILVYRTLFHRLNSLGLPGPWWARYTKLWHCWESRDSKNHLYLHKLHQKYGDVVRTGKFLPSE